MCSEMECFYEDQGYASGGPAKRTFCRVYECKSCRFGVNSHPHRNTGRAVTEVAQEVVDFLEAKEQDGIDFFDDLNWRDLIEVNGIGKDKAVTICAAIELGRRLAYRHKKIELIDFNSPQKVSRYFMEKLRHETQEKFIVSFLNVKNKLLGYKVISQGSLDAVSVDIKEAMKWAIRYKAHGLIILHNHPSGSPEPSDEDINVTRRFKEAAELMEMELLDHVIIGDGIYVSLNERGFI